MCKNEKIFFNSNKQASLDTWNDEVSFNVFGTAIYNPNAVRNVDDDPIGQNTVTFEDLGYTSTIAFARTWYNPTTGEIVESDVVFNSNYLWSISDETVAMDTQNIATHEFDHYAGLLDLYNTRKSSENTMYGYSNQNLIVFTLS